MVVIEAFPGQGTKGYPDAPSPETALFRESMANHDRVMALLDPELDVTAYAYNSFGLFTALTAAGVLDQKTTEWVIGQRSAIVEEEENSREKHHLGRTGMAALIDLDSFLSDLMWANKTNKVFHTNDNGISHVIGGDLAYLENLQRQLGRDRVKLLPINGAYHCSLRDESSYRFAEAISEVDFKNPYLPIIASTEPRFLSTGQEVQKELVDQMCRMVSLPKVVGVLESIGTSHMIDVGPGQFWKKVMAKLSPDISVLPLDQRGQSLSLTMHEAREVVDSFLSHSARVG